MTFTVSEDQNSAVLTRDDGSVVRLAACKSDCNLSCRDCALCRFDGLCIPAEELGKWPRCGTSRKDGRFIIWKEVT